MENVEKDKLLDDFIKSTGFTKKDLARQMEIDRGLFLKLVKEYNVPKEAWTWLDREIRNCLE